MNYIQLFIFSTLPIFGIGFLFIAYDMSKNKSKVGRQIPYPLRKSNKK